MISKGDRVTRLNTSHPTGIVVAVNGNLSATVRWGISDGTEFVEELSQVKLQSVLHEILSPDEVVKRQIEESKERFV